MVDLKEMLANVDKLKNDPVLLELLSILELTRKFEEDIVATLEDDEIRTVRYENIIDNHRKAIHRRIMAKLGIEEYYDKSIGFFDVFLDYGDGGTGIDELIKEIKRLLIYTANHGLGFNER